MPVYCYVILAAAYILWFVPLRNFPSTAPIASRDARARWGILLQSLSYAVLWQSRFWLRHPAWWVIGLAVVLLSSAVALMWISTRTLGRQWSLDAGVVTGHQLVRSGPYSLVRHPIYTGGLCLLLGTGLLISPWPVLLAGLVVYLAGTAIRVRIEEKVLAAQFPAEYPAYARAVPRLIPFVPCL